MSNHKVEQPEFLADVQKLQEKITSLKKRLDLVEENREKVRQKIYEKVKGDYKKKLDGLFGELKPFQEKIEAEITGLEDEILNHQEVVENNQEELEEFQLRFFAGEFSEEEYEPKQTDLARAMESSKNSVLILENQITDYRKYLNFITGDPVDEDEEDEEDDLSSAEVVVEERSEDVREPIAESDLGDDSIDILAEDNLQSEEEEEEEERPEESEENILEEKDDIEEDDEFGEEEEESFEEFEPEGDLENEALMEGPETGLMKDTVDAEIVPEQDLTLVEEEDEIVADGEEDEEGEEYEWDCIPILDVVDGDFTGESYTIDKERITMGRGPNNDIQLATDTSVSRHHAQIALEGKKYVLVDLESSNGTSVNGMRITRAVLKPNDELMVGQSKLIIRIQD